MIENIFYGLTSALQPEILFAVLIGVLLGMVVGILPGLTSTLGVALLVPLTFAMSPEAGLAMLGGMYCASTYSGAISAILIGIPGTPANIATLLDGYAMTKKGKANQALVLATIASCIGGFISVFALLFIAPGLAQISLKFGSFEYFMLAIFGISIIASLAEESLEKGLISGVIGILLATVGMHPLTGFLRFTYGRASLFDGIPVVVGMVGLYSIPEIIGLISKEVNINPNLISTSSSARITFQEIIRGIKEIYRQKWNVLRSTIIGIIVGIIPGAGCSIGGFVAYDQAKRFSKEPEKFGKGSIEGVIASETGNNATPAGTLIPLLTLGVPGNAVSAVFLGALIIHGLHPGADLFAGSAGIMYTFIMSLFFGNLFFVPIGLLICSYGLKILLIPRPILASIVGLLAIMGSFTIRANMEDVLIMLAVGLIGYAMVRCDVPRAPAVLGLVLGAMAESELARSFIIVDGNYWIFIMKLVTRPICLILLTLTVLSILRKIYSEQKKRRNMSKNLS